jgi:cell division protein FtsW (lipid II flippase)
MIFSLASLLILIASYGLYLVSSKQIAKTQKSKFSVLTKHIKLVKLAALVFIIIALTLYNIDYGNSISFVALCVLSTPLLFGLILSINDLKPKTKK